jgi:hypothetical protein
MGITHPCVQMSNRESADALNKEKIFRALIDSYSSQASRVLTQR